MTANDQHLKATLRSCEAERSDAAGRTPALRFDAVTKSFPRVRGQSSGTDAIADITGTIREGEFLVIVGPSGCGKSTFLEMVAGLQPATSGSMTFHGEEIRRPHKSMSVVFQEESLFPWRTVLANVEFGLEVAGVSPQQRRQTALDTITLVGLSDFADKYPRQLSGGMRQRVAIARALAVNPDVLLMDEPFGALDQQTRYRLGNELLRIWEETQKMVLFVTHDISEAVLLGDRVWVMSQRPGVIKLDLTVNIPRPRSMDTLSDPRFHRLTDQIWQALAHVENPEEPGAP